MIQKEVMFVGTLQSRSLLLVSLRTWTVQIFLISRHK